MREGVVKNPGQGEQIKTRAIWWILHKKSLLYFLFLIFVTAEIPLILNERKKARSQSQHTLPQRTRSNQTTRLAMGLWTSHPKAKELEIQSCSWINSWPLSLIGDEPKPQRHTQLYLGMSLRTRSPAALFLSSKQWQCFGFFFLPFSKLQKAVKQNFSTCWGQKPPLLAAFVC